MNHSADATDQELILAIRRGESRAFETLYYRYRDWVTSLAYRFCGNREDALDVLQETFAYLIPKLSTFELRSQMKTFLYPVIKHLSMNRRRPTPRLPVDPTAADAPSQEGNIDNILRDLPSEQREVIRLRFVDELSLQEIGEALGIPLGTVKSRLHAALETIRRTFSRSRLLKE